MKKCISLLLMLCLLFAPSLPQASAAAALPTGLRNPPSASPGGGGDSAAQSIIEEMVVDFATRGEAASAQVEGLLRQLCDDDADLGARWEKILALWKSEGGPLTIHYDVLPDGLSQSVDLCLVVLGFQLEPDGSMREELTERLTVALNSAEKYPQARIVCTGGGTAAENPSATEAGEMAKWLIAHGVEESRVLVEDRSLTTAQNAICTWDLLAARCPDVTQLAIISSDYHIATGTLLFQAEAILRSASPDRPDLEVVSHAAWKAPSGTLSAMFQAGALIELSGDSETAFAIYYDNYTIHDLPPLPEAEQEDSADD